MSTQLQLSDTSYTNKDFQKLYPELLELAKSLSYKWDPTISNESDPGVTLIKEMALLGDKNNYVADKNVLETFPLSVTQQSTARQLFQLLGYFPKWYFSAISNVTLAWKGSSSELSATDSIELPLFTMISDSESEYVYTLIGDNSQVQLLANKTEIKTKAIEGTVSQLSVNGNKIINIDALDSNNRIYFTESNIAQNGIFIANYREGNVVVSDFWTQTDNLQTYQLGNKVYSFNIDPITNLCYIEFPSDISDLIEEGLYIYYILSSGANGNIQTKMLSKFYDNSVTANVNNGASTIVLNADNFYIDNIGLISSGSNPESIDAMYKNYKKTVGTFDTLVTLRDYNNALYRTGDCSNVLVTDRTNDVQDSYKIVTKSDDIDKVNVIYESNKTEISRDSDSNVSLTWKESFASNAQNYYTFNTPTWSQTSVSTDIAHATIGLGNKFYTDSDLSSHIRISSISYADSAYKQDVSGIALDFSNPTQECSVDITSHGGAGSYHIGQYKTFVDGATVQITNSLTNVSATIKRVAVTSSTYKYVVTFLYNGVGTAPTTANIRFDVGIALTATSVGMSHSNDKYTITVTSNDATARPTSITTQYDYVSVIYESNEQWTIYESTVQSQHSTLTNVKLIDISSTDIGVTNPNITFNASRQYANNAYSYLVQFYCTGNFVTISTTTTVTISYPYSYRDSTDDLYAFDLKVYALKPVTDIQNYANYATTFTLFESINPQELGRDLNVLLSDIEDVKCVQHDYQSLEDNRPMIFRNVYEVDCKVIPQGTLSKLQTQSVKENISNAIYNKLNANEIDFSESVLYDDLYNIIINADLRIKNIFLENLTYNTYCTYKSNDEVSLYSDYSEITTYTVGDRCYHEDVVGTTISNAGLYVANKNITNTIGAWDSTKWDLLVNLDEGNKITNEWKSVIVSDEHTDYIPGYCVYESNSGGHVYKFYNYRTYDTTTGTWKYESEFTSKQKSSSYMYIDITPDANGNPYDIIYRFDSTSLTFKPYSVVRYLWRNEILAKNILSGVTPYLTKENSFVRTLAQVPVQSSTVNSIDTSEINAVTTNAECKTIIPAGSSSNSKFTVKSGETIQFYRPSLSIVSNYSTYVKYEFISTNTVPDNSDYVLTNNECLVFYYKTSDSDSYYQADAYFAGTIIGVNQFGSSGLIGKQQGIASTQLLQAMYAQLSQSSEIAVHHTITSSVQNEDIASLTTTLNATKTIDIKEKNEITINDDINYCYFILNNKTDDDKYYTLPFSTNDVYMLQNGEYFFYTNSSKTTLDVVGSGTLITLMHPGTITASDWKVPVIDSTLISSNGVSALEDYWKSFRKDSNQYIKITEQQFVNVTAGGEINYGLEVSPTYPVLIKVNKDGYTITNLPTVSNIASSTSIITSNSNVSTIDLGEFIKTYGGTISEASDGTLKFSYSSATEPSWTYELKIPSTASTATTGTISTSNVNSIISISTTSALQVNDNVTITFYVTPNLLAYTLTSNPTNTFVFTDDSKAYTFINDVLRKQFSFASSVGNPMMNKPVGVVQLKCEDYSGTNSLASTKIWRVYDYANSELTSEYFYDISFVPEGVSTDLDKTGYSATGGVLFDINNISREALLGILNQYLSASPMHHLSSDAKYQIGFQWTSGNTWKIIVFADAATETESWSIEGQSESDIKNIINYNGTPLVISTSTTSQKELLNMRVTIYFTLHDYFSNYDITLANRIRNLNNSSIAVEYKYIEDSLAMELSDLIVKYKNVTDSDYQSLTTGIGDLKWSAKSYLSLNINKSELQNIYNTATATEYHTQSLSLYKNLNSAEPTVTITPSLNQVIDIQCDTYTSTIGGTKIDIRQYDSVGKEISPSFYCYSINTSFNDSNISYDESTGNMKFIITPSTEQPQSFTFSLNNRIVSKGKYLIPIQHQSNNFTNLTVYCNNIALHEYNSNNTNINEKGTHFLELQINDANDSNTVTFTISGTRTLSSESEAFYMLPMFEYAKNDLYNKYPSIDSELRKYDYNGIFNYTYEVSDDKLIENPLLSNSFNNTNHFYNRYTICQASIPNILVVS